MSDRGHVIHAPWCNVPLNEHSGNEACLEWKPEEVSTLPVVAHYKQGSQGNLIADYHADYLARRGRRYSSGPVGSPEIADRRDNRDPAEVGAALLASRNGSEPT